MQLTTENGLPQNSVNQIMQDLDGYIWMATQDGLSRYNGHDFLNFRPDSKDSFAISDNFIIQIVEDEFEMLWIRTRNAVNVFEKSSGRFYKIDNDHPIYSQPSYLVHHEGSMYTGWTFQDSSWVIPTDIALKAKQKVQDLGVEKAGGILDKKVIINHKDQLITLGNRYMSVSKGGETEFLQIPEFEVGFTHVNYDFLIDNGMFYFHGDNTSYDLDMSTGELKGLEFPTVLSGIAMVEGQIWVGSEDGIFERKQDSFERLSLFAGFEENLQVHDLFTDSNGLLWIGTANQGVLIYNPTSQNFQYTFPNELDDLADQHVWSISESDDSKVIGTNAGLLIMSKRSGNIKTFARDKKFTAVHIDSEGTVWAGTGSGYLYFKPKGSPDFKLVFETSERLDFTVFKETQEVLWIGSYSSLLQVEKPIGKNPLVRYVNEIGRKYVMSLYTDTSNQLWIGYNNGISILLPDKSTVEIPYVSGSPKSPNFNFVSGIQEVNGRMWLSTYDGGLSRMNADSTFTHFTESNGLANNVLHALGKDDNNMLWMTSNGGLTKFDPTSQEFVNFGKGNGLISTNFSICSMSKYDSTFHIGTIDGALAFNPGQLPSIQKSPKILIEKLEVNYEHTPFPEDFDKEGLVFTADDKVFTLDFTALHFANPKDVTFEYKLQGFNENWVRANTGQRSLAYSSLPSGSFLLSIRALSESNKFSPSLLEIPIEILPPFWLKPTFYIPAILAFMTLVIGLVYSISRRSLKARVRELETREKVQRERERISRDLHDSVGTNFAYIISKLDFLYLGWSNEKIVDKKDYLRNVMDFARAGMRTLRETIWALDQAELETSGLKAKIGDYLRLCFTDENIELEFHFDSNSETINSSLALNSFRIIQEAVSNSIKHGFPKKVSIHMQIESEQQFELVIVDNGKGFDVDRDQSKNGRYGLKNMEIRAKEIGAHYSLESSDSGTKIRIQTAGTNT